MTIVCSRKIRCSDIDVGSILSFCHIFFFWDCFLCLLTCCTSVSAFLRLCILYADWKMSFSLDLDMTVGQNSLLPRIWHYLAWKSAAEIYLQSWLLSWCLLQNAFILSRGLFCYYTVVYSAGQLKERKPH